MPSYIIEAERFTKETASEITKKAKTFSGVRNIRARSDSVFTGQYRFTFQADSRRPANKVRDLVWEYNGGAYASLETK